MKNKICLLGALLLMLTFGSCQKDSETLIPYDHTDELAFMEAENSFAGKYKLFWNAMNQNYALWDYEMEQGLDWDAEYDKFLPQFEELDKNDSVSDDDLKALMEKMVEPLHDGHMFVEFKNHKTGEYVMASPSTLRNAKRSDYINSTDKFWKKTALAQMGSSLKKGDVLDIYYGSTQTQTALAHVINGSTRQWLDAEIARLSAKTLPTEAEVNRLWGLRSLSTELSNLFEKTSISQLYAGYNKLVLKYGYLEVPGLEEINPDIAGFGTGMAVTYALLKGNIVYMYLSDFSLGMYLDTKEYSEMNLTGYSKQLAESIQVAWQKWFDKIQELHNAGTLGGVIIDVRCDGGGRYNDYQYVLGALLPSGGIVTNQLRYKRGTARLDYSPLMPQLMPTYPDDHAVVTEPIVVLADCGSVSMSEITARGTKLVSNARLIGKRTWGGLCALNDNSTFSFNYSGHTGVREKTPVYIYTPLVATFSMDGEQFEGIGIEPDIEVDLDVNLFNAKAGDTQLERALQYIRTGN